MANKSTLILLLLFAGSKGYGYLSTCSPHKGHFENVQEYLKEVAPQYGVHYNSKEKIDTHPTLQRILDELNSNRERLISSKRALENYTADKLKHYEITPKTTVSEVDKLQEVFRMLDDVNDEVLEELEKLQKEYANKQQELNEVQEQIQAKKNATIALQKSFNAQNVTLTKTLETQEKLNDTIIQRGLKVV